MIKKQITLLITLFFSSIHLYSQNNESIEVFIDSTSIMIGEKIDYYIKIKSDTLVDIKFSEKPFFLPFEILEEYPLDTVESKLDYLFTKKYSLIHFDSGNYWLPNQKLFLNGSLKILDSILIKVKNVSVDTLKQPLYDIKPIEEVKKNYFDLIKWTLIIILISVFLIGLIYFLFFKNKIEADSLNSAPPFERAIQELKELESFVLKKDQDYKEYYSSLTGIVRRYLEEDAKVSALESTSDELLLKLEALKTQGVLDLKTQTLNNLKNVLKTADLVKFAKSIPEKNLLYRDRSFAEELVIETNEVLPELSEEELREQEEYKLLQIKKRRKKNIYIGVLSFISLIVFSFFLAVSIYGFYPVIDTIIGNPTIKLKNNTWVTSQYGNPPVKLVTPDVLRRIKRSDDQIQSFSFGNFDIPFYIDLIFKNKKSEVNNKDDQSSNNNSKIDEGEKEIQELIQLTIDEFNLRGATNIFSKKEEVKTFSGIPAIKFFGTLDYPLNDQGEKGRFNYSSYVFDFKSKSIILSILYAKDDRYAIEIENRIVDNLELIKEL
ncbi:MAG: hypothetical protein CMC91_04705 [Flavobacteriaceae bacterium]|nr:hypothetical protein [Flavobacteriaceae bacterium]MBJ25423.1 hypothetical protein [Flavobacteriaceae bacterium]